MAQSPPNLNLLRTLDVLLDTCNLTTAAGMAPTRRYAVANARRRGTMLTISFSVRNTPAAWIRRIA
jgi:hypothetical protein